MLLRFFPRLDRSARATELAALALVAALMACGARTGLEVRPVPGPARPVARPEICNGLDDDLDGLAATSDASAGEAGTRDASSVETGPFDGGSSEAGARDAGRSDASRAESSVGEASVGDASMLDAGAFDGGRPQDLDLRIDEDFRDALGRYVTDAHCGVCGHACTPDRPHELAVRCGLVEESPVCVATSCDPGYTPSRTGRCVPVAERLCLACADDGDCGDFVGARCTSLGGEQRCAIDCALGCPTGFACREGLCAPPSGSCSCEAGDDYTFACALEGPMGLRCPGSSECRSGVLSACVAPIEQCDHEDQDCDGAIDEGFRDSMGAYGVDIHHCGDCGVDCTTSTIPEGDLVCGGDPFAPSCVLRCPDTEDGIQPGDRVDADRNIATGCECTVSALDDEPGPVRAVGQDLDVNCDGADGMVRQSFYVAPDGDDAGPGSPSRPLRHIDVAIRRAAESLATSAPRAHVFVASGTYAETVELRDGVLVHGGYRRDFLALDPDGFRVEIRAPRDTTAVGGAAIVGRDVGRTPTVLEWVVVRGLDAISPQEARFGMSLVDAGAGLTIRAIDVRSGVGGSGVDGVDGEAGRASTATPMVGQPPRGAVEGTDHECVATSINQVAGGEGGQNVCDTMDTRGGRGGSAACPVFGAFQGAGTAGTTVGPARGGDGGSGGQDSVGPITADRGTCPVAVCCGLADFTVPSSFIGPQPGSPGGSGRGGVAGGACTEAFGSFVGDLWTGQIGSGGTAGTAGSGGGGGGAGGGARMNWFASVCEFVDGLGGGGGGGGAGGCGGRGGTAGSSGAPSVAILLRYSSMPVALPQIRESIVSSSEGGRGGDGGAGGDGGQGENGAFGGSLERASRVTPTLSGPFAGARGGAGGNGGAGGGGGGGCGGASGGVWISGTGGEPPGVAALRSNNTFRLGTPGESGRGGGGGAPGADGMRGGNFDVLVR